MITGDQRLAPASVREAGRDGTADGPPPRPLPVASESSLAHDPPTHAALLERSRALEIAVIGRDRGAVHLELCRLRAEMCEHIRHEHDAVEALPPFKRKVVSGGQRDLLEQIDQLLESSAGGDPIPWLRSTVSIVHRLVRQARLEANIDAEAMGRTDQRGAAR